MEAHLVALDSTLESIRTLHSSERRGAFTSSRRPFTSAILNTHKLDVLDFIRDADAFESNLFWYPPSSAAATGAVASSSTTPAASSAAKKAAEEGSLAPDISVAPRLPEPKAFVPPTPLRKHVKEAEARGLIEFDARTLLKAAQKLLDNYHNAPRARKHIKTLLRKHSEVQRANAELEETVAQNDALITRIQSQGKQLTASIRKQQQQQPKAAAEDLEREKQKLESTIQREEMEIMAIEQMMQDLAEQKSKLRRTVTSPKKQPPSPSVATPKSARRAPSIGNRTPKSSSSSLSSRAAPPLSVTKSAAKERESRTATESVADETIRLDARAPQAPEANLADETIRLNPEVAPTEALAEQESRASRTSNAEAEEAGPSAVDTAGLQSTDELERISENIWTIFGDHLRFASSPDRETGNLQETLEALRNLSLGHSKKMLSGPGDESIASSSAATQTTAATSGSSTSGTSSHLSVAGAPSPTTAIAAHILTVLLNTAAPHTMDFDQLKREADTWWTDIGRTAHDHDAAISTVGSNTPGGKAIYELTAKRLLKLRFAGKQRIVSFPANIP